MVERLSGRKIVVVDLDGTLIDGNSLHLFLRVALRHAPLLDRMRIARLMLLRRLRKISHVDMKFGCLGIVRPDEAFRSEFVRRFRAMLRPEIVRTIDRYKESGDTVLLATAAADMYVKWIWDGDFVATSVHDNPNRRECRGDAKVEAVRAFMRPGDTLEAVFTDHSDDIPLLQMGASRNYLVDPSTSTVVALNDLSIPYTLFNKSGE